MSMTIKQLNAKIAGLAKRNAKWRDEVQLILVQCSQHAFDNKNVDPFTRLVHALKGADAKALIHWAEKHAPAVWEKANDKFRFNKSFVGEYDAITLLASPWWELATKPKEVASSLDVLDALRGFIKRMEREAAKEVDGQRVTVEHAELITKLAAIANDVEFAGQ